MMENSVVSTRLQIYPPHSLAYILCFGEYNNALTEITLAPLASLPTCCGGLAHGLFPYQDSRRWITIGAEDIRPIYKVESSLHWLFRHGVLNREVFCYGMAQRKDECEKSY